MKGVTKAYFAGTLIGHMAGFGRAGQLRAGYVAAGAAMAGRTVARVGGLYHPLNLLPKPADMQAINQEQGYRGPIARRYGSYHDKKKVGGPPMRMARFESRGGEHTSRSRTPKARKSMRGPSAHRRRDEDELKYRRRKR